MTQFFGWLKCEDCQGAGVIGSGKYGMPPTCSCGHSSGVCILGCFFMSPMFKVCEKCRGMKGHSSSGEGM